MIAGPLEDVRIHGESLGKKPVQVAALGKAMHSLTGEERGARRRARRRGREGVQEQRAFAGDAVERWRRNGPVAVGARMRERPVVGNGKENVRPRLRHLRRSARRGMLGQVRETRKDEGEGEDA